MIRLLLALLLLLPAIARAQDGEHGPVVLAAASLQESLTAAADAWAAQGHARPVLTFAASSALARQAGAGAPADLFISADEEWMDTLAVKGLLAPGTRAVLAGNRLVVVAAPGNTAQLTAATLAKTLAAGPLAMADPMSVPAGKYGRTALQRLGAWAAVQGKVVRAENVRAALALVERGAAPFGLVYRTDARASGKVRVAAMLPAASHPPIRYPVAKLRRSTHAEAEGFRLFLLSPEGRAVFTRYGFTPAL
jgi:molybdate transport system substrate-binding protein